MESGLEGPVWPLRGDAETDITGGLATAQCYVIVLEMP